jgi:hypothetical protein
LVGWVERTTFRQRKAVLQGEGIRKISSPHSIKILGTKNLPKWGGMIYIGPLYYFSSISMLSEWKKLEESTCRVILMVGPSLENWGLKPSRAIFEASNKFFWGQNIPSGG